MARGILFDLFNTLVASGPGRGATVRAMGAALDVDPDAFARSFRRTWHERMIGALGDLTTQCRTIAADLGGQPTDEQIARANDLRLAFDRRVMAVADDVLDTLKSLHGKGFKLAIVSNCTADSGQVLDETSLPTIMDALVLSYEVKLAKPDPRIYTLACQQIGVPPGECVYVGDGADRELYGAEAHGMQVFQTTQFALSDPSWPGAKVSRLADLVAVVGLPD